MQLEKILLIILICLICFLVLRNIIIKVRIEIKDYKTDIQRLDEKHIKRAEELERARKEREKEDKTLLQILEVNMKNISKN